ncbi:hypothetical protein [Duganella hordei]|jgi:hypothetical protein|uniref:hypothetical protein n=1 Tax=Duganella hordei TaxID=2865934 RepID=UPI0030EA94EA
MRKQWSALLLATAVIALTTASAFAAPVTYQFSGLLTDIRNGGAGFNFGDHFTANFTYDDNPIAGALIEPGRMVYPTGQFIVQAATSIMTGTPVSELQVFDNWTNSYSGYHSADGFFVSSFVYDARGFTLLQFDLWDNNNGSKLDSLRLPTQAQLVNLASTGRIFIRRFDDGMETGLASGNFSGISQIASVPEPGQAWTLIAGLMAIASIFRSRKALRADQFHRAGS